MKPSNARVISWWLRVNYWGYHLNITPELARKNLDLLEREIAKYYKENKAVVGVKQKHD